MLLEKGTRLQIEGFQRGNPLRSKQPNRLQSRYSRRPKIGYSPAMVRYTEGILYPIFLLKAPDTASTIRELITWHRS